MADTDPNLGVQNNKTLTNRAGKAGPERRCLVQRESGNTDNLIRFALDPDGVVTPDIAEKLPGRGAWVTATKADINTALERGVFAKGFKQAVKIPDNLPDTLERLLRERCQNWLGLARRGGQAIAGHDKVSDWIRSDQAALLIQGSDASERGRQKLRAGRDTPFFDDVFTAAELGAVFGRDIAVHVAIARGSLAASLTRDLQRLRGFLTPNLTPETAAANTQTRPP
ncbi:MAG: RNA-binding protein [Pseudomonadota bacterium]